jgi:hypothetical protein
MRTRTFINREQKNLSRCMINASVVEGTLLKISEIAGSTIKYKLFLLQLKSKNFLTDPSHIKMKVSSVWTESDRLTT